MQKHQVRNTLLLVAGALIWGVAFVAQTVGSGYVEAYTFLACRSWLACLFLAGLIAVRRRLARRVNARPAGGALPDRRRTAVGGALCGIFLFAASAAQQMGVGTISTAKASFLTALYIVLVPLAGLFTRHRPGWRIWVCIGVSVAGLYLLCLAGQDTLSLSGGEWQMLLAALLFAVQILLVGRYSPHADGVELSFCQFFTVSVLSTIFMLLFEHPTWAEVSGAAGAILYCGILSSGVGYTLQIIGQRGLDPTIASLAMCLESVFGALSGWLLLGQGLTSTELCGCVLMFAAIVGTTVAGRPAEKPTAQSAKSQQ
ncbi:DMT family transporter [uncultured Gemmiger sp.]|uniref:DMT family transporter n=1 Tax=uncultured Gemmiger sp. TaxID=1623490 RepID=UPI0025E4A829|nr:DMT family transporter [uncultured Gemmiger sp.]